jgi:hypothetical protein
MSSKNPNQPVLPGMPEVASIPLVMKNRNAVSRTLNPDYLGVRPSDYADITDEMRAAAEPRLLLHSLIDVPEGSPSAVAYQPGGAARSGYVALTPSEYGLIVRNPEAFSRAVRNKTLASRPEGDPHTQAANRSVQYALENKDKTQKYVTSTLEPWLSLLGKFNQAAANPGLSLMGSEVTMRQNFETFRTNILGNMLEALRVQRGWNDEQADFARRTIDARMFIDRENNQHIAYFAGLVAASQFYFGHKTALFKDRLYQSKQLAKQVDEF